MADGMRQQSLLLAVRPTLSEFEWEFGLMWDVIGRAQHNAHKESLYVSAETAGFAAALIATADFDSPKWSLRFSFWSPTLNEMADTIRSLRQVIASQEPKGSEKEIGLSEARNDSV